MAPPSGPSGMGEAPGPRSASGVAALGRSARQAPARTTAVARPKDARGCIARRIVSRFVAGRHFCLPRCNLFAPPHIPLPGARDRGRRSRFRRGHPMPRWPLVFVFAAKVLAGEQQPEARPDSARVARVLALLETSDSTACELAAQAIGNGWGRSWPPAVLR